jgi:sugar phosphate isomerase/epimerase
MGYRQTSEHRGGNGSYHQIGLVRGQFGDVEYDEWIRFLGEEGFDGWEEASWELELARCADRDGAAAYAQERVDKAKAQGLEIFSIATHLQGQSLGDEPSAKTLQFVGGEAVAAYKEWRQTNEPPRTDPFFVPEEVASLIQKQALDALLASVRLAASLGEIQARKVPLSTFTGSPAHAWSHWFEFPPPPSSIGGCSIADPREVALELIVERFAPVLDLCKELRTTLDLECHPSERAMGDIESASDYLATMIGAGYEGVAGFNLDCSHMEWQNVSGVDFIREFGEHIHCVHIKGVQVIDRYCRAGRLGGHRPMGHRHNGWNFVTPGSARDAVSNEEIIVELNRAGFDGALSIEWEDNDADKLAGARAALANVRRADLPPSTSRHDETLKA